jgi:TRAP-type C4-dicarboxylate transport system permease large subunit
VPFFLLTANLMNVGGHHGPPDEALAHHGSGTSRAAWRRSTSCCRFSSPASPGSSTADAASQSKIFIEAQTREGYDLSFSVAITAVSAVLAGDHSASRS